MASAPGYLIVLDHYTMLVATKRLALRELIGKNRGFNNKSPSAPFKTANMADTQSKVDSSETWKICQHVQRRINNERIR